MTPESYIEWRDKLAKLWQDDRSFMSYLDPDEQWDLHAYFQFHREKNREDALSHLTEIEAKRPGIEERVLAALERAQVVISSLESARQSTPARRDSQPNKKRPKGGYDIQVRSLVRPEVDADALAQVIIKLAKQMADEEDGTEPADGHVRGRCDSTADGAHPDLSAYTRPSGAKTQVNSFLRCCQRAAQEVKKQHVTISTASGALSKASRYPAVTGQPVLKILVELAAQASEASTEAKARRAWDQFTKSLAVIKIPS